MNGVIEYKVNVLFMMVIMVLVSCGPEQRDADEKRLVKSFLFNVNESPEYNKGIIDKCMAVGDRIPQRIVEKNYGRKYFPLNINCYGYTCIKTGGYFGDDIRYEDINAKRSMSAFRSCMKSGGATDNNISFCPFVDRGDGYCYTASSQKKNWYVSSETNRIYRNLIYLSDDSSSSIKLKVK